MESIDNLSWIPLRSFNNEFNVFMFIVKKFYRDGDTLLENSFIKDLIQRHRVIENCPKRIQTRSHNNSLNTTAHSTNKEVAYQKPMKLIHKRFNYTFKVYTEGSLDLSNNKQGIGIFHENSEEKYCYKIKNPNSIKTLEMMGIFLSIQQALEKGETRITIVTDSMSSVMSIKNSINNSGNKYFENLIIKTCDENQ